jgi:hypothetical protein
MDEQALCVYARLENGLQGDDRERRVSVAVWLHAQGSTVEVPTIKYRHDRCISVIQ